MLFRFIIKYYKKRASIHSFAPYKCTHARIQSAHQKLCVYFKFKTLDIDLLMIIRSLYVFLIILYTA